MKKGRHRRFEEARALKRTTDSEFDALIGGEDERECAECGAGPGHDHASWCRAEDVAADESW